MELIKKRILAKFYFFKIQCTSLLRSKKSDFDNLMLQTILNKYSRKEKIIVVCSDPSASKLEVSDKNLYLASNSAYSLVKDQDCLYYVNDGFSIRKILSQSRFLKVNQEVVFFYYENAVNLTDQEYLLKNISLLENTDKYFISQQANSSNYDSFINFYKDKGLPIKIQNSGVFLLLFGYYLAAKMNFPIEIYGLDLGIGGTTHFNNKGIVGNSVLKDRVKDNVKMYLNYMYKVKQNVKNYSNFFYNYKK